MEIAAVLTDAFARVHEGVREVATGLDAETLNFRPDPAANSIGWLIWHLTRVHDDHVADMDFREQVWTAEGWFDRFDLPLDSRDIGYGHQPQDVQSVQVSDPGLLTGYHDAVVAHTYAYLATLDADKLDVIVDPAWDPAVTAGVRLVSIINEQAAHLGQAEYLRGHWERTHAQPTAPG